MPNEVPHIRLSHAPDVGVDACPGRCSSIEELVRPRRHRRAAPDSAVFPGEFFRPCTVREHRHGIHETGTLAKWMHEMEELVPELVRCADAGESCRFV